MIAALAAFVATTRAECPCASLTPATFCNYAPADKPCPRANVCHGTNVSCSCADCASPNPVSCAGCGAPPPSSDCDASAHLAPGHIPVPCLQVPAAVAGGSERGLIKGLTTASGDKSFGYDTTASLSYDPTNSTLNMEWSNLGDKLLKNTYTECNSDMWNQEVVEIFLGLVPSADPLADPTHYVEVEISPHNALYVANISNPFTNGTDKTNTMIECSASGIVHSTQIYPAQSAWSASLSIPLDTLVFGDGYRPKPGDVMRVNLFRVVMESDTEACDDSSCAFGCWSTTRTAPSAFHHSNYFGVLEFV